MQQKYKTCRRWNTPGHAHELTFSCFKRLPLLTTDRARWWLARSLEQARARYEFDLWAYVIMPEHVHLLLHPRRRDYDISDILKAIKWPVTYHARQHLQQYAPRWIERLTDVQPSGRVAFRFWQRGGGYDRNVRDDDALASMVEYIHANPVRRELVRSPLDWAWSSARWYAGMRDVPILMDDTIR